MVENPTNAPVPDECVGEAVLKMGQALAALPTDEMRCQALAHVCLKLGLHRHAMMFIEWLARGAE